MLNVRNQFDKLFGSVHLNTKQFRIWLWDSCGTFGVVVVALFLSTLVPLNLGVLPLPSWFKDLAYAPLLSVMMLLVLNQHFDTLAFKNVFLCRGLFIFLSVWVFFMLFPKMNMEIGGLWFLWGLFLVCMTSCWYFKPRGASVREETRIPRAA